MDGGGKLTAHGERLATLPLHPRQGSLLVAAAATNRPRLGATLAALAQERDLRLRAGPQAPPAEPAAADALERLELLEQAERARHADHLRQVGIDPQASRQVARARDELLARLEGGQSGLGGARGAARLGRGGRGAGGRGHPDRVARRSGSDPNRATMVGGVAIEIDRGSCLFADRAERSPLIIASELARIQRGAHQVVVVRQGAETSEEARSSCAQRSLARDEELGVTTAQRRRVVQPPCAGATATWWCARPQARSGTPRSRPRCWQPRSRPMRGAIVGEDAAAALPRARAAGLGWRAARPRGGRPRRGRTRARSSACCSGCVTRAEVLARPKLPWLTAELDARAGGQAVEAQAPGRSITVAQRARRSASTTARPTPRARPVLAVRLQELFGMAEGPRIAGGIPVLLHLLAPNYRVEQITDDLASFWANTYAQVRKDLRARYPKHAWPEDPLTAPPQAKGPSVKRS